MLRKTLHVVVFALALCAIHGLAATAAADVPAFDPSDETVLLGPGLSDAPDALATLGTWRVEPDRLQLEESVASQQNFWIPSGDRAVISDGFVRFRLDLSGRVDSTVLFRVAVEAADPAGLSGYGISLEKDEAVLYRWDDGTPLNTGVSASIKKLKSLESIEGAIWLVGPFVTIQLFDGERLTLLATITHTDHTYASGRVGYRVFHKQDPAIALTLLTVRKAGTEGASGRVDPVGRKRWVEVAAGDLDRVPDAADARVVDEGAAGENPAPALLGVSIRGLELIRRAGVQIERVHPMPAYSFRDSDVRKARREGLTETREGFDLDDSYKDPAMVEAILRGYHARYPELTSLVEIGRSHGGLPILALKISDNAESREDEPAVLLNGGHHGVEFLATEFVVDALGWLLEHYDDDPAVRRWVDGLEIWVVPLVNPDGNQNHMDRAVFSGRKNGRDTNLNGRFDSPDGVDLNRNYPFRWHSLGERGSSSARRHRWYRGPVAGSEPETQAMMRLADSEHFVASISYHTFGTVILAPYTIDDVENPSPNETWPIAEAMSEHAGAQANGRLYRVQRNIYSVDGVDQDWFRAAHGTVALLVEGAYHNPYEKRRLAAVEANRGTWISLLDRALDGPAVWGTVTDRDGHPVVAEVTVEEIELKEGEHWTSRCHDGRFERMLAEPGSYTITVRAPGFEPVSERVRVSDRRKRVDFVVDAPTSSLQARVCPDPEMCAADTWCLAAAGTCVEPGPAQHCRLDGGCVADAARDAGACNQCAAATLALEWTPVSADEVCGSGGCSDGAVRGAATCDGEGACSPGEASSCAPFALCTSDGSACADGCADDTGCVSGFVCTVGRCVEAGATGAADPEREAGGESAPSPPRRGKKSADEGDGGCGVAGIAGRAETSTSAAMALVLFFGLFGLRRR